MRSVLISRHLQYAWSVGHLACKCREVRFRGSKLENGSTHGRSAIHRVNDELYAHYAWSAGHPACKHCAYYALLVSHPACKYHEVCFRGWKWENGSWKVENGKWKLEVAWHLSATVPLGSLSMGVIGMTASISFM